MQSSGQVRKQDRQARREPVSDAPGALGGLNRRRAEILSAGIGYWPSKAIAPRICVVGKGAGLSAVTTPLRPGMRGSAAIDLRHQN
jgi:hypothetical protein